jgi:SAM-dependent methyltransferase
VTGDLRATDSGVGRGWRRPLRSRRPGLADRPRLVLASFVMLFVELALIRWTSANNLYLVHLTNFVLLASFLGIGLGFLLARAGRDLFLLAPVGLAGLVAFVLAFPVQTVERNGGWGLGGALGLAPLPRWVSLPAIFLLTVGVMASLAQEVARTFALFEPLEAYRLDVLGSIAGIAAFAGLSFLRLPPLAWALLVAAALVGLLGGRLGGWQAAGVGLVVLLLGAQTVLGGFLWSPYYKVRAVQEGDGALKVDVNNTPHQTAYPMDRIRRDLPFYFFPYTYAGRNDDVLIIGAGTGNDAAVALTQGAQRVDAVEIDPVLQRLGRQRHPERPYQDPRVTAHVDDGRAFLERTDRRYDLILLALPDSATIVTGQAALRLENYLFTTQALEQARSLLKPGGTFAMYNYYEPWLVDRYANTLQAVYGTAPCVQVGQTLGARREVVLSVGADGGTNGCTTTWKPESSAREPSTDDRPFPYLADRAIPRFYLWMLGLILLASVLLVRVATGPLRQMRPYADLFFMGGAFLLLETKNVVQFALLFGTTWFVNAAVFAGVLLSVLAAIEVARRSRLPRPALLYLGLLVALALAWVVPQPALLSLPVVPRFAAGVAIAFAPIFLANLVFAQRFRTIGASTVAFGANLLGAMVGGAFEYLALVAGFRSLLILVAVLYGLAFLTGRRHLASAPP